ncbi:hypothetical protein CL631_01055 [bacterium]|jgi:hypothetical protein|nr:hypothetical protein [bacterium]MDP6659817.1 hypothetical protein [Candidatus Paceibacterota bacterium]|tara:strand:- start:53245 stop:54456 length:1212 start_codon:yes stop_codon:yes gene_type:complete
MLICRNSLLRHIIPFVLLAFLVFLIAPNSGFGVYPEVKELEGNRMSFDELGEYFTDLTVKKGGTYGFEVLKRAELPPGTDLHFLGHFVGDELYRQEGVSGMSKCTHGFRNACSHAMVIGAMVEFGEGALPLVKEVCKDAPGGSGAYTMCFHGFGHGVFAYTGYNFEDTVKICSRTGTPEANNREFPECIGGAVMELLGGGGHDKELWEKAREKYLSKTEPRSLCEFSFMTDEIRPICYTYLTPHLFEFAGGDLGHLTEENYRDAFLYCDEIPISLEGDRLSCFGSLGKEFVVLAQNRDVRKIDQMTNTQLDKVYELCKITEDEAGQAACVRNAVQSLFWGGENDRGAAIRFCSLIYDDKNQFACFSELVGAVGYYIKDKSYYREFCSELPDGHIKGCRNTLLR